MQIGLTQVTAQVGGKELLEYAHGFGFAGVEPMIGQVDSEYLSWSCPDTKYFADSAEQMGVSLPSVAVGIFNEDSALVDGDGCGKAMDIVARSLEFSASIGAKVMLLCTYFASHPDTSDKKANLLGILRQLEPIARKLGVAVALESPLSAPELIQMVDSIGSDYLGIYYDVGNSIYLGFDPAVEIEALGRRIMSMHIKDTAKMLGDSHLGRGRLDLAASIRSLRQIGYDGWLMLETPGGNPDALKEDLVLIEQNT